jgi:hypothetical protein
MSSTFYDELGESFRYMRKRPNTPECELKAILAGLLQQIEELDSQRAYDRRNELVSEAVCTALSLGLATGYSDDPKEPGWVVTYIELPTGQVSWHLPSYIWDGHTTQEKYARCRSYYNAVTAHYPQPKEHHGTHLRHTQD